MDAPHLAWARSVVRQCREAGVPCFVKQLGARAYESVDGGQLLTDGDHLLGDGTPPVGSLLDLRDRKGGDWSEWPEDLRVREFPTPR